MVPTMEYGSPAFQFACDCGWTGRETDIDDWAVEIEHDRVVRCCPGCGDPIPEWGTYRPIDGISQLARGPMRQALREAGIECD